METRLPIKITAHDQLCIERVPERPCGLVIFGASGDLAHRKLIPALYHLYREKLLPANFFVLGAGRKAWDDSRFRAETISNLEGKKPGAEDFIRPFSEILYYCPCDYHRAEEFIRLKTILASLGEKYRTKNHLIFYLALPPEVYGDTILNLLGAGLLSEDPSEIPATRVVVEKPFGRDLSSARELALKALGALSEKQIYRIDHYLGKETVQNILMLRFANSIFESIWNRQHIDHIQITASETLGVGHRAGYYESAGVLRDMFQNHMLELLSLVAMEPPLNFDPAHYRDEKAKVLKSIRPFPRDSLGNIFVRGQYAKGMMDGREVPGYREEKGIRPDSETETFAALKLFIDNWRWQGVPFYLRSGKRLAVQQTEIIIQFKTISHSIFTSVPPDQIPANKLCIRIQPDEGIYLSFNAKHPGPKMCMATLGLEFDYAKVFREKDLSAYERLLLDAMHADPTLFVRQDMVEVAWALMDRLLEPLRNGSGPALLSYPAGSWGPEEALGLIARDGRSWGL